MSGLRAALCLFAVFFARAALAAGCPDLGDAMVHVDSGGTLIQAWTVSDDPTYWQDSLVLDESVTPELDRLVDWVKGFASTDPFELLKRQRAFYANSRHKGLKDEVRFYDRILEEKAGGIYRISCLEALLLTEHLKRSPTWLLPTEFQAVVMSKHTGTGSTLRVHFASGQLKGTTPALGDVMNRIVDESERGWAPRYHLHNHPFDKQLAPGEEIAKHDVAGTTIPSTADANSYLYFRRQFGLLEARITNGISSIHVPSHQFEEFSR